MKKYFIIDFDSTFVQSEGLEELARVALKDRPDRDLKIEKIKRITNLGMEGKISFEESLKRRLSLLRGNKLHIAEVVRILKKKVSPSIRRNRKFFKRYKERIYIISGSFKEFILPIVKPFGIQQSHVLANTFIVDRAGKIRGSDLKNPLAHEGGKVNAIRNLKLKGEITVVGDGYTDFQIKEGGEAKHFVAYIETVRRETILKKSDYVVASFDEFLILREELEGI